MATLALLLGLAALCLLLLPALAPLAWPVALTGVAAGRLALTRGRGALPLAVGGLATSCVAVGWAVLAVTSLAPPVPLG